LGGSWRRFGSDDIRFPHIGFFKGAELFSGCTMPDAMKPDNGGLARLIEAKRDAILEICRRNGASNVAVFGSVARGEAMSTSDVDFLVDLDADRSLLDHIGLQQELEDLLGVRVAVVTRRGLHPLLRDDVLAEAVPV
jgi:hypothetical protein